MRGVSFFFSIFPFGVHGVLFEYPLAALDFFIFLIYR